MEARRLTPLDEETLVPEETISHPGTTLVRRLVLEPGMATPWHFDPFCRVTVVIRGEALAIEYRNGQSTDRVEVFAGQADWDEPADLAHRAVNVGHSTYEEVTIFFLDRPDALPQPIAEGGALVDESAARRGVRADRITR